MSRLTRLTDRVLDKLVGSTKAGAGCYEQTKEWDYMACPGGLRSRYRYCTYTGSTCQYKSCGSWSSWSLCSLA